MDLAEAVQWCHDYRAKVSFGSVVSVETGLIEGFDIYASEASFILAVERAVALHKTWMLEHPAPPKCPYCRRYWAEPEEAKETADDT